MPRVELQVAFDVEQVLFHQLLRGACIAALQRIDDGHVLFEGMLGRVRRLVHERDEGAPRQQVGQHVSERLVAQHVGEHDMKVCKQPRAARHVDALDRGLFVGEVGAQPGDLRGRDGRGQPLGQRRFEHLPHLEDLACFFDARFGHARAARRFERDKLVAAQAVERLAHDGARHVEDVGDLLLGELGARNKAALDDGGGDGLDDALGGAGNTGRGAKGRFGCRLAARRRQGNDVASSGHWHEVLA